MFNKKLNCDKIFFVGCLYLTVVISSRKHSLHLDKGDPINQFSLVSDLKNFSDAFSISEEIEKFLLSYFSRGFSVSCFEEKSLSDDAAVVGFRIQNANSFFFFCATNSKFKAGTFSYTNLTYLTAFLDLVNQSPADYPLVFLFHSGGVRITQSRRLFNLVWGILPKLFFLNKKRIFISLAHEKCLGAAALFFGQAHFRIASSSATLINLTGPGVIKRFYGNAENFSVYASARHQNERNFLVHEITDGLSISLARINQIIEYSSGTLNDWSEPVRLSDSEVSGDGITEALLRDSRQKLVLKQVCDHFLEILPTMSAAGRTFLCSKNGKKFAVMMNPLDHAVNSISVKTVEHFLEALIIFKALKLNLISIVDSPGGDPRQSNSDQNIICKTLTLVEALIDYPFKKIGLIAGRCYGGSGVLSLPTVHQSAGLYALTQSKLGVMSDEVINSITSQNLKTNAEWKKTAITHTSDFSDLIDEGVIKKVIPLEELSYFIDDFCK